MQTTDEKRPLSPLRLRLPRRPRRVPPAPDLAPPPWVTALFDADAAGPAAPGAGPLDLRVTDGDRFTLATARVADAADLDDPAFERAAAGVYRAVAETFRARPGRYPVRFWNHLPDIRRRGAGGVDRYMVFNAGRFEACGEWFGSPASFDQLLPTASAVGHDGRDLVVHALAAVEAGVAVENPRQVPSYRYSRRFGPRPPCFARATVLPRGRAGDAPLVLVGGTASIRGEDSVHVGNLRGQVLETFENLSALAEAALAGPAHAALPGGRRKDGRRGFEPVFRPAALTPLAGFRALHRFTDLRVYYARESDRPTIARMVAAMFPHLRRVEYVRADLCRPELLVEIEGLAG